MEDLLAECFKEDENMPDSRDFEIYKSNICHLVKDKGDIDFIIDTLKENQIRIYWERRGYPESFYLLAMVDYLSRENDLPLCNDYEDIRNWTLSEPLYPRDVIFAAKLDASLNVKEQCLKEAIPEFMRFNIVESEIRNVCWERFYKGKSGLLPQRVGERVQKEKWKKYASWNCLSILNIIVHIPMYWISGQLVQNILLPWS